MKKYLLTMIAVSIILLSSCQTGPLNSDTTIIPKTNEVVEVSVTGLESKKTYYWKIVADDGNGNVAESETWTFETE